MNLSHDDSHLVVFWLLATVVATLLAMGYTSASYVDGHFIPAGNDSFYHARRILDAASGERGFYQFDSRIHVPEGSWLTWPWAYDYLMSRLVAIIGFAAPGSDPMDALAHLPLAFLVANTALMTLLLRESGLGKTGVGLALVAFALSPMTQSLHGIGRVDHHMAELSFVLASTWLGLRYFADPARRSSAIALGAVLGFAPAFHNSLFILQIPLLVAAGICWLRGLNVPGKYGLPLAASLVLTTLLALLPSKTFLDGQFQFATHSLFHLYAATGSALVLMAFSRFQATWRSVAAVSVASAVFVAPILLELFKGASFLAGETALLDEIVEVRSPLAMWMSSGRLVDVTRYYGLLIVAAPILMVGAATVLLRSRSPRDLFLMSAGLFGLALLVLQFRLHPFGMWALPVISLWLLVRLGERVELPRRGVTVAATLLIVLSLLPPVTHQLFVRLPVGLTERYELSRPIYLALGGYCRAEPGVVLAIPDDGHPIRYHSDCAVIANNFLLTRQHGEKALLARQLLDTPAAAFRSAAPRIRYLLLRPGNLWRDGETGIEAVPRDEVLEASPALVRELFARELPDGFELLGEIPINDGRDLAYARLVRVN